ncbi:fatty acid synthase alpha subunit Lsd1 [Marasmius crinis-equi]|uniref:Fatty acid synthase alpha subunit Lsd1 n=1 Tax=Marasmius crinis-equi TaxID=585013 RepID=A0ABR3FGH2_9AGAR
MTHKGIKSPPAFAHYPTASSPLVTVAEIVNDIKPEGQIFCTSRGKELVFGVGEIIVRVHFALEGHCFWMPTLMFQRIIQGPPVRRGEKSKAFRVPPEFLHGPNNECLISIQAAIVRPDYTFVFCDHNNGMVFHVMLMKRRCTVEDFKVGSEVWPYLWSKSHGPDAKIERNEWSSSMENFRAKIRGLDNKQSKRSVYGVVKSDPLHFNGLGAQEGCDLLIRNFIHPLLPMWVVCSSDELWGRLFTGMVTHFDVATETALALPHVSSDSPLRMMSMAHKKFLDSSVLCYKRSRVFNSRSWLDRAITEFNLFDANAVLDSDGRGQLPEDTPSMIVLPANVRRNRSKKSHIPNYVFDFNPPEDAKEDGFKCYCPFRVNIEPSWREDLHLREDEPEWVAIPPQEDVEHDVNSTTVGPFSFSIFVLNSWTDKHITDSLVSLTGKRRTAHINHFRLRRPLIFTIMKGDRKGSKKRRARQARAKAKAKRAKAKELKSSKAK